MAVQYFISPQGINLPAGSGFAPQAKEVPPDESQVYVHQPPIDKIDQAITPAEYSVWEAPNLGRRPPTPNILPDITDPGEMELGSPFVKILSESRVLGTDIQLTKDFGPFPKNTVFHCAFKDKKAMRESFHKSALLKEAKVKPSDVAKRFLKWQHHSTVSNQNLDEFWKELRKSGDSPLADNEKKEYKKAGKKIVPFTPVNEDGKTMPWLHWREDIYDLLRQQGVPENTLSYLEKHFLGSFGDLTTS